MRKLKIIQILPTLNTGGVERGVLDFNKYLVDKGHESYVISNGGRQVKNIIKDGGTHIHLQVSKKSIFTLLQAKKLADIINEISPDIVHIRSRIPAWVLQTSKLFLKNPRPVIFSTFHGLYSTPFYSRIMASFDRVISISKTVDKYVNKNYQRYLKKPTRLIFEGADEKFFYPKFSPTQDFINQFYAKLPNLKGKKLITYPGKLSSWRGQESFIKLLSDLPNDFAGLILGNYNSAKPKYYKSLQKLIEDYRLKNRVYFYDVEDDLREIYCLSKIVLNLSSKPEAFGMKLLQAAMMEKKIAGWNHGGSGEILEMCFPQGKVEFNNFDLLKQKIKELAYSEEVPKNIFLTSNLLHEKTVAFYFDALNKNY